MLEQLLIFTRGGLVLWTCKELGNALKGSPIDALIQCCLLEERSADASFNYDAPGAGAYTLKWTFNNDLGLVFVVIYQRIFHLFYVDEFSQIYDPKRTAYHEFDDTFRQLQKEVEARAEEMRKLKQDRKAPAVLGKKQGLVSGKITGSGKQNSSKSSSDNDADDGDAEKRRGLGTNSANDHDNSWESRSLSSVKGKENGPPGSGAFDVNKLQKPRTKDGKKADAAAASKDSKKEPKKL